jgi:addiction module RelE/StbE family toxin
VWTRPARDDRKAIREDIATDKPRAAITLDELISAKAARLARHPALGRLGRMANTRELVIHRSYVLIYDLAEGDLVRILRVLHTALQWPPIDPELLHSPERAKDLVGLPPAKSVSSCGIDAVTRLSRHPLNPVLLSHRPQRARDPAENPPGARRSPRYSSYAYR